MWYYGCTGFIYFMRVLVCIGSKYYRKSFNGKHLKSFPEYKMFPNILYCSIGDLTSNLAISRYS